ncbi:MAG: SSS family solute:Na+ symporter [Saprospiraceae bacterium]|jgi:SSS family solute:Na+ symporter
MDVIYWTHWSLAGSRFLILKVSELARTQKFLTFPQLVQLLYNGKVALLAGIYADTVQCIILMVGLVFIGVPLRYTAIGGIDAIRGSVPSELLSF